ncbi:MAG: hypothetical protein R2827_02385 [Bdellovibrionales bacterium]
MFKWFTYFLFFFCYSELVWGQLTCLELFYKLPTRDEYVQESYEKWDPEGRYNFRENNPGELRTNIEQINEAIRSGQLKGQQLIEAGIVEARTDQKMKILAKSGKEVEIEYYEYRLVHLGTSLYVPTAKIAPEHIAAMVFLPGTGSNNSTGKTMIPIAQTLTKVSYKRKDMKPHLGDRIENGQVVLGVRAYSMILDPPGNGGYGKNAPDWYTTPEGTILTLEHVRLVIQELISPDLPIGFAGRSQGGIQAKAYHRYAGYDKGVILDFPVNLSPSDFINLYTSVKIHEDMFEGKGSQNLDSIIKSDDNTVIDPKMWLSYRLHTTEYQNMIMGDTEGPSVVLYSRFDGSYDQRFYEPWIKDVVRSNKNGARYSGAR